MAGQPTRFAGTSHEDRRQDSATRRFQHSLNYRPERVAVGGGSVWVTARDATKPIRIDARRSRVAGMIDTGLEP